MSAPRIPAIGQLMPGRPVGATAREAAHPSQRLPLPGETLRLTRNGDNGAWSATGQEGQAVRLSASLLDQDGLAADLSPGDVLLVKVLSTTPRLELARLGPATTALPGDTAHGTSFLGSGGPPPAMRPDQAAISRVNWAPPDADTLAMHWQVSVLAMVRKVVGEPAVDVGRVLPPLVLPPLERWLFPVHAWTGLPLALHLQPPPSRDKTTPGRQKPGRGWGLRLAGLLSGLGRVEVQVQTSSEGVELTIVAEDDAVLSLLRKASGLLNDAVLRAGERLQRCRWLSQLPAEDAAPELPPDQTLLQWQALPNATLFRVGAEVLVTLGGIGAAHQRHLNPAYR